MLRFLFSKRLENLLIYKKWWYLLFISLTTSEEIHSGLLSDLQDGKSDSSLPWAQGNIFWGTWIVEMVGSSLGWTLFKALLFLRTSSRGSIYASNSLRSLPASLTALSSFDCLHSHRLFGCRVDIWSSPCWTNSWHTWKLTLWALLLGSLESVLLYHKRVSPSLHCSKEPLDCGKWLAVFWKRTLPSLCWSLTHAMIVLVTSVHQIFLACEMGAFPSCISNYQFIIYGIALLI